MGGFISLLGFVAFFAGWYFMLSAFRAPYGRKLRALGIGCLSLFLSVPLIGSQGSTTKTVVTPKPIPQTRAATKPTKKAVKPAARATAKPLTLVKKPRVIAKPKPRVRAIAAKPKPRARADRKSVV